MSQKALFKFLVLSAFSYAPTISAQEVRSRIDIPELKKAQTAETDEILVEARKRPEKPEDVPISTKVFRPQDLHSNSVSEISELISLTPSTNFSTSADNHRTSNFSVRGVTSAVIGAGVDQPTAFYFDDVYIGNQIGMNIELLDIEQVELLRGPQGTLYGKNAFAGALNVFSARPKNKNESSVELIAGNLNLFQVKATNNAILVKNKLFSRMAVSVKDRDGYVENLVNGDKLRSQKNVSARAKLRYIPSKRTDVIFSTDYTRDRPTVSAAGDFDTILTDQTSILDPFDERRDILGASLKVTSKRDAYKLTSISSIRGLGYGSEGSDFVAAPAFIQGQFDDHLQLTQELRFSSKDGSARTKWVAGTFAYYEDYKTNSYIEFTANGNREASAADSIGQSYAAFGDITHGFTKDWDVTAGIRYTHEVKDINYNHGGVFGGAAILATQQTFNDTSYFNNISPKISTSLALNSNIRSYATVSRGFKSGGFNNLFVTGDQFAFKEETGTNYEVGLKTNFFKKKLKTNVSAFYFDWQDMQIQSLNSQLATVTSNAANASSVGVDADIQANITSRLSVSGGYNYTHAEFGDYKDFPNTASATGRTDVTGNRIPFNSQSSFVVGAKYNQPLPKGLKLVTAVSHNYKGSFFFDALNTLEQAGYGLLNGSVTLKSDVWSLSFWGKNLTDERYRTVGVDRGALGKVAATGEPATYGVSYRQVF